MPVITPTMIPPIGALPSLATIEAEIARRQVRVEQLSEIRKYWDDPAGFVQDCFKWKDKEGPTDEQLEIVNAVYVHKRVSVRGPHGLGKTAMAAWLVHWYSSTRDGLDWKIPTTASAWRQLTKYLWPEIHKWSRRLRWEKFGREPYDSRTELQTLSLKLATGEAFAVASDQPELIEGAHADHLFYLFDEAKVIPVETFDAAEGAFSGGQVGDREALAFSISTPGPPKGRFYDIQSRKPGYEDWWVRHVTLKESVKSGRISNQWAAQRAKQWGANSAVYKNRVLGEFAASGSDAVIPLEWIDAAIERWKAWKDAVDFPIVELTSVGCDISDGGPDLNVLSLREENTIAEIREIEKAKTMDITGRIGGILKRYRGVAIVDVIGVGAGCVGRLRELKHKVIPYNGASSTKVLDKYGELGFVNLRSAAYWHLRELLDPESPDEPVLLPDNILMIGDLTAPNWAVTSTGKIQITTKEKVIEELGRSPDTGDSVVMAFAKEILEHDLGPYDMWGGYDQEDEFKDKAVEEVIEQDGMFWPEDYVPQ